MTPTRSIASSAAAVDRGPGGSPAAPPRPGPVPLRPAANPDPAPIPARAPASCCPGQDVTCVQQCPAETGGSREKARRESAERRTADILRLHAYFVRVGCFRTAEMLAVQACQQGGTSRAPRAPKPSARTRLPRPAAALSPASAGRAQASASGSTSSRSAPAARSAAARPTALGEELAEPAQRQNVVREVCCPPCVGPVQAITAAPVTAARMMVHLHAPVRFVTSGNQVRVMTPSVDARGERAHHRPRRRPRPVRGRRLHRIPHRQPAREIQAHRIVVNLADGSYEINPAAMDHRTARHEDGVRQATHNEACPVPTPKPAWKKVWACATSRWTSPCS